MINCEKKKKTGTQSKKITAIIAASLVIIAVMAEGARASKFDELDKPPEGAHKGQMFLGAFFSMGGVFGEIIDAENDFVRGSTHEFNDSEIIKKLWIDHLGFAFGICYEYMYIDHMGVKAKLKKTIVIERTLFGSQYKNWTETLYSDYTLCVGPTFHITNRKQWDFTFTPVIGVSFGELTVTPIADKLIDDYSGKMRKDVINFTCGGEFNFSVYFSGGLFISIGFDYTMNMLELDSAYSLTNPDTDKEYFKGETSSYLHSLSFILSAGYAFSN
ncbi:MAG TPA: hypothetical protein PK926_09355 [Spirochaetota bacterium]|nr:hypothetical protein [Spirochaetota bacterium]HPI89787.1 hypothetical protein [Spirochaetota bacterium]HPR47572.1 hypothetical protein [Spirochaetota bacterium]